MRLSHKFQKVFSRDAAESLWEHACRWTHPVNPRRILATIDRAELELDLGCGPGYFLYLSQLFGHEGLGLDPGDEPFFRGTTEFFGVRRVIARIHPQTPLPDLGKKFDLVTGHRVCFHRIARSENGEWLEWSPADWKFFITDIRTRFLKPDGRLLLEFNRRQDGSSFFTPELRAFFQSQGARIFRWKALLAADANQRPRFNNK